MASPFNMPEEFVRGFFKSGQTLLEAYMGVAGNTTDARSEEQSSRLVYADRTA